LKTIFRKSFERDLKRIKDRSMLEQVKRAIEEVEAAASLKEAGDIKSSAAQVVYTASGLESNGLVSWLRLVESSSCDVFIAARFTAIFHNAKRENASTLLSGE